MVARRGDEPTIVRLHGIDAPELDQPWGPEAKEALERMALGRVFYLDAVDIDRYGRTVAVLHGRDWRESVNREMVEIGLAYNWPEYGRLWGGHNAQRRARSRRVGVWTTFGGGVRPWIHRRGGTQTPIEYTRAKIDEAETTEVRRRKTRRRKSVATGSNGASPQSGSAHAPNVPYFY